IIGARAASAASVSRAGAAWVYRLDCLAPTAVALINEIPGAGTATANLTVCPGSGAAFNAFTNDISYPSPVSYQWRKNGVNNPGETGRTFVILNVSAFNAGTYDVVVTNACGVNVSNPVTLNVYSFSLSPASQNFSASGSNGSVSVIAQFLCGWTATSNAAWI